MAGRGQLLLYGQHPAQRGPCPGCLTWTSSLGTKYWALPGPQGSLERLSPLPLSSGEAGEVLVCDVFCRRSLGLIPASQRGFTACRWDCTCSSVPAAHRASVGSPESPESLPGVGLLFYVTHAGMWVSCFQTFIRHKLSTLYGVSGSGNIK